MLKHYRRIPTPETIGVDAMQLTENNAEEIAAWCGGHVVLEHDALEYDKTFPAVNVPTYEGMKRAQLGDYVIKDVTFEFHVRKPGDFESKYEPL